MFPINQLNNKTKLNLNKLKIFNRTKLTYCNNNKLMNILNKKKNHKKKKKNQKKKQKNHKKKKKNHKKKKKNRMKNNNYKNNRKMKIKTKNPI